MQKFSFLLAFAVTFFLGCTDTATGADCGCAPAAAAPAAEAPVVESVAPEAPVVEPVASEAAPAVTVESH